MAGLGVGCGGDEGEPGGTREPGAALFAERCGSCHSVGEVDPARVRAAIETPPEGMPANLADPDEARQIADYVAASSP